MSSQQAMLFSLLFLLSSTCQKPLPVHAESTIHSQFYPQDGTALNLKEAQFDYSKRGERIARQASSSAANSKDFNGGGIYWLAADGPTDFQMWPAMGAAYGSGQAATMQQMGSLGGGGPPNGGGGQGNAAGQSTGQQQQLAPTNSAQQQQQQTVPSTASQQLFPQIQQQGFQQNAFTGYGQMGQQAGGGLSPYAGYLEKQISSYPVMIYTLADCIPCQRAKHMLAVHYPDVRAHYLELSGNEPWQQQLQIDLQYLTGAMTFPYIFVCGQYIGGSTELFELHESGQLRRLVSQCLQKLAPK